MGLSKNKGEAIVLPTYKQYFPLEHAIVYEKERKGDKNG